MSDLILVAGATGTAGSLVTKALLEKKAQIRVLTRDTEKAKKLFGENAKLEYAKGDLDDLSSSSTVLKGVSRAFILATNSPQQFQQEVGLVNALLKESRATLKQVVKLSALGANASHSLGDIARIHGQIENKIEETLAGTQVSYTTIRPTFFFQNLLGDAKGIKERGHFYRPGAQDITDYKYSQVDARDIADTAAFLLTAQDPKKYNQLSITLTGPEIKSPQEVADTIGEVIGKKVQHIPVDDVAFFNTFSFLPEYHRWYLLKLLQNTRAGSVQTNIVAGDFEILTGKKPRTLKAFIEENKEAFA